MTREEAVIIAYKKTYGQNLISLLEALGLLKFDETQLWRCGQGETRAFAKGIDPNHSSGYVWTKVYRQPSAEFLTIPVGSHTHDVALETIVKALNAKGCTVYRNGVEL